MDKTFPDQKLETVMDDALHYALMRLKAGELGLTKQMADYLAINAKQVVPLIVQSYKTLH